MANYKIVKVDEVRDVHADGPDEMRMLRNDLDSEQIALTYRRIPAGHQSAHGHTHSKQDEVLFVFAGTLRVKLDDEIIEVGPKTALKIAPEVKRGYHNTGTEDVELIIVSPQAEFVDDNGGQPDPDWWPAE